MALDKLFETLNFLKNKIYTSFQRLSTGLISDFDILINEVFFGALKITKKSALKNYLVAKYINRRKL